MDTGRYRIEDGCVFMFCGDGLNARPAEGEVQGLDVPAFLSLIEVPNEA